MKKNKKNISATDDRIFIEESDLAAILKDERWMPEADDAAADGSVVAKVIGELIRKPSVEQKEIDIELLTLVTSSDIIDKFLRAETHRIVAEEGEPDSEITTEAKFSDEDDMVSEELAEVYLQQGLKDMAIETYRKLSLLNPEKSIYFAELISKIEN